VRRTTANANGDYKRSEVLQGIVRSS